jgi:hypothetical protein
MTTFDQLVFEPYRSGVRSRIKFSNGYGASVVRHEGSYGGSKGLYELAILKGDSVYYDTQIANDVLGWLEPKAITDLLRQIEALEAA